MHRVRAGFCETVNPFNANQVKRVPLVPVKDDMKTEEGVETFVFWTRNPCHILTNADELTERGFCFYVMVTITGYPKILEPSMTNISKVLNFVKKLSDKIGKDKVIWRYDPIFLSTITDKDFHLASFNSIAEMLTGYVRRVIISTYDEYKESKRRLDYLIRSNFFKMLNQDEILPDLLTSFKKSADAAGMEIQSCAQKENYSSYGVKPGACIDAALLDELFGLKFKGKDRNQRSNCLCCKSIDIGAYKTCTAGCVYCYAI